MTTTQNGTPRRVFIVDDHPVMRAGVRQLIEAEQDLAVCGEADSVNSALEAIAKTSPDVALVDITLRQSNGLDLIKDLQIRHPKLPVLVLSMHDEAFYAERVLRAGARGYIAKAEGSTKIVEGLRKVLDGGVFVSQRVASSMVSKIVAGSADAGSFSVDRLSDRELQIFELIGQGLQTRDIAQQLHLSPKTVEAHREHIKAKLDMDNASELLAYAVKWVHFERDK